MTITDTIKTTSYPPDYTLNKLERYDAFFESVRDFQDALDQGDSSVNAVLVSTDHILANVVRSIEMEKLPSIPDWLEEYERNSKFLLILPHKSNSDEFKDRSPAHVFRLNIVDEDTVPVGITGLRSFDDFLFENLATEEELIEYYGVPNIASLGTQYIDIPANIGLEEISPSIKHPYSALGYKAIFEMVMLESKRGVVAYQNDKALKPLSKLGVRQHALCGDESRTIVDDDAVALGLEQPGLYHPLTIEATPFSRLNDGSPAHNTKIFTDSQYAKKYSRIAALVASQHINLIKVL